MKTIKLPSKWYFHKSSIFSYASTKEIPMQSLKIYLNDFKCKVIKSNIISPHTDFQEKHDNNMEKRKYEIKLITNVCYLQQKVYLKPMN